MKIKCNSSENVSFLLFGNSIFIFKQLFLEKTTTLAQFRTKVVVFSENYENVFIAKIQRKLLRNRPSSAIETIAIKVWVGIGYVVVINAVGIFGSSVRMPMIAI